MSEQSVRPPLPPLPLNAEGILKIVLITVIGGIGPGAFMAAQSRLLYVILVYPLLMAIGAGLVVAISAISFQIKNRTVIATWTLLVGLLTYGSYRTADYFLSLQKLSNQAGHPVSITFADYLIQTAKTGLTIASLGGSEGRVAFAEPIVWIYWVAEVLIILGGATLITTRGLAGVLDG